MLEIRFLLLSPTVKAGQGSLKMAGTYRVIGIFLWNVKEILLFL